jgi:hypothetical protein
MVHPMWSLEEATNDIPRPYGRGYSTAGASRLVM